MNTANNKKERKHTSDASADLIGANHQWDRRLVRAEAFNLLLNVLPLLRAFAIGQHWFIHESG
jgi:hypothetical protein